ncbi:helicase associated domain-containing protein [Biscogniauxia sp. FL1348]|nr:helicase associated domain-containing protein [Biscogniauxia sp. FL1348]
MVKKFVPRQRKHKVIARQRAAENAVHELGQDSNAAEIIPDAQRERQEKKTQLREQLRNEGIKVSSKKAKRLDKYVDNKLKKDENRALLAQLASQKIDTSLFASSRNLGQGKQTKRQLLSRALKEEQAGIGNDEQRALLYQKRESSDSEGEGDDHDGTTESTTNLPEAQVVSRPRISVSNSIVQPTQPPIVSGSGLKRPLEVDDAGRPVIAKRVKRGGIKTSKRKMKDESESEEHEEWGGFGSDEDDAQSAADSDGPSDDAESSGENSEEPSSGGDDDSEEDSEDEDMEEPDSKQKSSAFKAWAHQERNKALGYQPVDSTTTILDIPRPKDFKPRPIEEEPLPLELQPTANTARKAHSVTILRDPEVQEARLKLPVVADEQRIMEAIHNHNVVVICGSTGSGKTTQVPQFLYEAGYGAPNSPTPGMIGVTQPRRVAAVSMHERVKQELGVDSKTVAYQIRFEGTTDAKTAIKFMTDGVLLREVSQDIALHKYSAIIIDEAHERSVNTDILIGMLSRVVKLRAELSLEDPSIRPLKLIIMSATLRVADLTQNPTLFPTPPPVIEVEGRQYPVTIHFARRTRHDYIEEAFQKISRGHRKLPPGDFLVFLTGQNEILQLRRRLQLAFNRTASARGPPVRIKASEAPVEAEDVDFGDIDAAGASDDEISLVDDDDDEEEEAEFNISDEVGTGPMNMQVLPLYSLLPTREQMRVFEPPEDGSRKVILATNVAETSLTIPGIRYIIDCGRSKERRFDKLTGIQSFEVDWISKASANQRSGRAGRTGPGGHCWRLYSSAVYERDFPEFAEPELLRSPLEGIVLQLKAMKLQHVVNFPFPTPPERQSLMKAEKLLSYLSAVTSSGQVTPIGSTMSVFPLAPRFARILLVGHLHDCLPYTVAMVAGLSVPDIFIQENQAIPQASITEDSGFRTQADVIAEDRQAAVARKFRSVQHNFRFLDDKSDAIKLLQVVGEFAHEPTDEWCENHFVRFKALQETLKLRQQIIELLRTHIDAFKSIKYQEQLDPPTSKQVSALKQMVAAGFIDQVAIRADLAPSPPEMHRKPRRAIDVPYIPLIPIDTASREIEDRLVFIHPSSSLAHLSTQECPQYIVYSYLQKSSARMDGRTPKTRMHALTDVTGSQLSALAKGTPLISYGKPIKEFKNAECDGRTTRECLVKPFLRAEGTGGIGWPLPEKVVRQRKVGGNWVVE